MDFLTLAKERAHRITALRRRLHACPETGFDLPETEKIIREELTRMGIPFRSGGRGYLTGTLGPRRPEGILLRADTDGLTVREEANLPFRAENGNMHACGHDLHTAMLLGALEIIREREKALTRPVRFFFQPAEEILQGARDGVEDGICDGISRAYMIHVALNTGLGVGTVILPPAGEIAPSADYFEILLQGKGCHGADPASGLDPLSAGARILLGLQHLPSREMPSGVLGAVTVGSFSGGDAYNVIPDSARLSGTARCFGEDLRQRWKTRIDEIARHTAAAYGLSVRVNFPSGCPALKNDPILRERALSHLHSLLGPDRVFAVDSAPGTAGSEDFAEISRRVPSVMFSLAAGDPGVGLHHPAAVFDEGALPYGTALLASLAFSE